MYDIRKAVPEDALGITIVNVYTWKTTYTGRMPDAVIDSRIKELPIRADKCREDIEKHDHRIVAAIGNTIIGYCAFGTARNTKYKNSGEIYALYVLHGYQGMNIGKALFIAGIKALFLEGFDSMIINCLQDNPAIEFYKHIGGKIVGQRQEVFEGHPILEDIVHYENLNLYIEL